MALLVPLTALTLRLLAAGWLRPRRTWARLGICLLGAYAALPVFGGVLMLSATVLSDLAGGKHAGAKEIALWTGEGIAALAIAGAIIPVWLPLGLLAAALLRWCTRPAEHTDAPDGSGAASLLAAQPAGCAGRTAVRPYDAGWASVPE